MAHELASEGHSVVVLEQGGYFPTESFQFNCTESVRRLYLNSGLTFAIGVPTVLCPVGKTVGGTTTINQGTALRIPRHVLQEWRVGNGLKEIDPEEMSLYYAAIEEFLFVKKADPEVAGNNARKFLEGASKLGLQGGYLPRNAKDCEGYGVCSFGCPSGAKQSMNVSYIPEAVKKGADVYADCKVTRVLTENGRAVGVEGFFKKHDTRQKGPAVSVSAKVVVLAGGTIGTPLLLMRNKLANSSGEVGWNYRLHPVTQVVPIFEERIDPHKGISQSAWVDEFLAERISLETTVLPPDMLAMAVPAACDNHSDVMSLYPYTGLIGCMLRETSKGRIVPGLKHGFYIFYQINWEDVRRMKLANVIASEIAFAAGAKRVLTFMAGHNELTSLQDLKRLKSEKVSSRQFMALSGWHPMGTCRMGDDPESSVVRHTGETWDVENLFISDASVFPTSIGVNPQLTIMAFSLRCAGFVDEKLIGESGSQEETGTGISTAIA